MVLWIGDEEMEPSNTLINKLTEEIVALVHPLRVIVFGSAAREEMNSGSDIDVMVVMPDGTHRRKTAQLLYKEIVGLGVPFDIVVTTPNTLKKHENNIGLIYATVLKEGIEVYAI